MKTTSLNATVGRTILAGKTFHACFSGLSAELNFASHDRLTFTILNGKGLIPDGYSETVAIQPKEIRSKVFFLGWEENSGSTVSHIEDHNQRVLYTHITLPDGTFLTRRGGIYPQGLVPTDTCETSVIITTQKLKGKRLLAFYEDFYLQMDFLPGGQIQLTAMGNPDIQPAFQTVPATIIELSQGLFLLSWKNDSGTTVVQTIDTTLGTTWFNLTTKEQVLLCYSGSIQVL